MNESKWMESADPSAMLRVATGRRSNCCGCLWAENGDNTLSMLPGEKCCPRCDNAPFLDGWTRLVSDRKLRLFACACCRSVWDLLRDERSRRAVEVAERYADSTTFAEELIFAYHAADEVRSHHESMEFEAEIAWRSAGGISGLTANSGLPRWFSVSTKHAATQAAALRCIAGNPFRPVKLANGPCEHCKGYGCRKCVRWLTPTVVGLAEAIYAERSFDRMPVLRDALEDAGCTGETILAHCRTEERARCEAGCDSGRMVEKNSNMGWDEWNCTTCKGTGWVTRPVVHARGCWVIDMLTGRK